VKLRFAPFLLACTLLHGQGQGQGQGQGNGPADPFHDKNEKGETVKILPAPAAIHSHNSDVPTDAPPSDQLSLYSTSYGSGLLIDHGGMEIPNASFQPVYWNATVAKSTATSLGYSSLSAQISAFVTAFSDSANFSNAKTDDYNVIQQYGSHVPIASTLTKVADYVGNNATVANYTDTQIQAYLTGLFNAGALRASNSVIYGLYFPAGMQVCLGSGCSCSSFCGYHSHFTYGSTQIKYAVFPYPNCSACSLAGKSTADMLTIIGSHEIREAVTNPGDFNAYGWYDANGYEGDDKCAWHNLYQMSKGGFWVQPEYSNGGVRTASGFTANYPGPGCVVPR
jgi:hypothetical protein